MTQHEEIFAALAAPFEPEEVKARTQAGRTLSYITARTAMNRLDDVLGPENWWDDYTPGDHGAICRLTIRLPDGQAVTKVDAGGDAGMSDPGDDEKSGFSDAFKRAAVKFGVGRYLYRDGVPRFARESPKGGQCPPPREPERPESRRTTKPDSEPARNGNGHQGDPRTGRALFAWVDAQEKEHEVAILRPLIGWGKRHDLAARIVDWDGPHVAAAVDEARRIVAAALDARRAATPRRNEPVTQEDVERWEDGRE